MAGVEREHMKKVDMKKIERISIIILIAFVLLFVVMAARAKIVGRRAYYSSNEYRRMQEIQEFNDKMLEKYGFLKRKREFLRNT